MLVPTSTVLITSEEINNESLNTIKIDFAKMSFVKSTQQKYTQCSGCKALLTIDVTIYQVKDKKYVSSKNTDIDGNFVWNCRFCQKQNKNAQIYFVSSNFKHCLSKNASTKIVPPIILFLIDISGSMTSSIYTDILSKSQQKNQKNSSLITTQMKKIIEDSVMRKNQAQYLADLQKSFGNKNEIDQKVEHFSKLSFLFSIIEYHLKILKSKKQKSQFRVGFVFFSDSLIVLKGAKQKSIPMYIHETDDNEEIYPFKKQKVDFNNFKQLYQKGKSYDRYFGDSRFSSFDMAKLSVQYIKTGGKTALGPALAFASGVISQHDEGSKVIVVTDSLPNYGILSSKQSHSNYKQISSMFQQSKATMGIFRLVGTQYETKVQDKQFQQFIKANSQVIKLIEVSISPSITQQVLQNAIKSLRNLITYQSVGHSYNLTILNDNKKITLNKFKYDNIDYRNLRFITSQSKNWIQVTLDKTKINESDLLFPTMTQLVIEYDDVWTKQKYLFMSYIQQNIIKNIPKKAPSLFNQSQNSQTSFESFSQFMDQINLDNIQTIFDMQCMMMFQQQRQSSALTKRTYRSQLKNQIFNIINKIEIQSIDCQNINDYTSLKNKILDGPKAQKPGQHSKNKEFIQEQDDYESL